MARIDVPKEDRDREPLQLSSLLDCPECQTTFEHVFTAPEGIFEREDLIDPPTAQVKCPNPHCGEEWFAEWEGWTSHEDAG